MLKFHMYYRIKKIIFIAVIAVTAILFSLLITEIVFKVSGIGELSRFRHQDFPNNELFCTSDYLPFELPADIPGFSNSFGMRDKEYRLVKTGGVYRIIVMGDSITMYGQYTDFLEDKLNKQFSNAIEVWNCSIAGHGIKDYYHNLVNRLIKYEPDMLLIGLCFNDFELTPVMFKSRDGELRCYRPFRLFKSNYDNWLYCNSNLYRTILVMAEKSLQNRVSLSNEAFGSTYLTKIKDIAEKNGWPFLCVVFPNFTPFSEDSDHYNIMIKVLDKLDIDYIDLHKVFRKEERASFLDNPDDTIHPNKDAHMIAADEIVKYLTDNRIINTLKR